MRNFLINNFLLLLGWIFQFHDFLVLIKLILKVTINYMYQVSHDLEYIYLTKKSRKFDIKNLENNMYFRKRSCLKILRLIVEKE